MQIDSLFKTYSKLPRLQKKKTKITEEKGMSTNKTTSKSIWNANKM